MADAQIRKAICTTSNHLKSNIKVQTYARIIFTNEFYLRAIQIIFLSEGGGGGGGGQLILQWPLRGILIMLGKRQRNNYKTFFSFITSSNVSLSLYYFNKTARQVSRCLCRCFPHLGAPGPPACQTPPTAPTAVAPPSLWMRGKSIL